MCLSRPPSQLPVPSVAGLIGVTTGQAVVTGTELFTDLIGWGGEQQVAPSNQCSSSGQELEGVFRGVKVVQAHSQFMYVCFSETLIHKSISHT